MIVALADCIPVLELAKARRARATLEVWDLGPPRWPWGQGRRLYAAARAKILSALIAQAPNCFLNADVGEFVDWPEAQLWPKPSSDVCNVPADADLARLEREVLYEGDYLLYVARQPLPEPPSFDFWRATPEELVLFLASQGVDTCLIPWRDDIEWRVVLGTEPSPRAAV